MGIVNYPAMLLFLREFFKPGQEFCTSDLCDVIMNNLSKFPVKVEDDSIITSSWVTLRILRPLVKQGHIERTSDISFFKKSYYIMK